MQILKILKDCKKEHQKETSQGELLWIQVPERKFSVSEKLREKNARKKIRIKSKRIAIKSNLRKKGLRSERLLGEKCKNKLDRTFVRKKERIDSKSFFD